MYIIVTSGLTIFGSGLISLFNSWIARKRDLKIISSDIVSSTYKLLRTFVGLHNCSKTYFIYLRLSIVLNNDKFYREQFIEFQKRANNLSDSLELHKCDLQKHVNLYLSNSRKKDFIFIINKMKIINESIVMDYKDLALIDNIEELKKLLESSSIDTAKDVDNSLGGGAMKDIINHFFKNFLIKAK